MEKFKSKIDLWIVLFLAIILGGAFFRALYEQIWGLAISMGLVIAFVFHLFINTFYIIESKSLIIKSGFFVLIKIDIQSIRKISETNNILSSPALSLDRIEIIYNKFDTVLISPKEKKGFIEAIQKINPEVEIRTK